MNRVYLLIILAVGLGPEFSWATSIGVYSDANCECSSLELSVGGTTTVYINAVVDQEPIGNAGIYATNFAVTGLPAGWNAVSIVNPEAMQASGDPFGSIGAYVRLLWFGQGCVTLYTVTLSATTEETDVTLQVGPYQGPAPDICPLVSFLRDDLRTECATGTGLDLNAGRRCTTAVNRTSWALVKRLY